MWEGENSGLYSAHGTITPLLRALSQPVTHITNAFGDSVDLQQQKKVFKKIF